MSLITGDRTEWNGHRGEICARSDGFDVIDCEVCGFKHIIPLPSAEELEEVYRHEYYSTEKPLYLERANEDRPWTDIVYDERYSLFESLLPDGARRILDVGSGPGFFLLRGVERGWEALGFEPSKQSAEHSRRLGLNIVEEFLSEKNSAGLGLFDVVHLSHVLEHIPDPRMMLQLIYKVVKPGGLICIMVPNDFNPFQKALQNVCSFDPWWVAPPHHVNYFDFESLKKLMRRCGFELLHKTTSFPIDLFLLMGENYVGHDEVGRLCHQRRKQLEMVLNSAGLSEIKLKLYQAFADVGVGRDVLLIGQKGDSRNHDVG